MSYYRQELESFLSELDVSAYYVIDLGGKANPVKGRTKSWTVSGYDILDLPEYDLEKPLNWQGETADVVFMLEVLEYILDDIQAMKNLASLLTNKDSKAYVSAPLCYPTHNDINYDSRRYTERGLERLAESAGLRVTNVWYRRDKSGLLKAFYAADGMRAAKEYHDHSITGFIAELSK